MSGQNAERVSSVDTTTGGLVTVISTSGKFALSHITLSLMPVESLTVKMTVDGVVIFNDTFSNPSSNLKIYDSNSKPNPVFLSKTSLSLEVESSTGTGVQCDFIARASL